MLFHNFVAMVDVEELLYASPGHSSAGPLENLALTVPLDTGLHRPSRPCVVSLCG